ncbi:DUF4468 domain-containing protein [Sphingobacterium multivorum]|uniref:DUF4468 domain-containing protein n=1 Tax=Sphingobacterium multivorum TaxID=28454 RepID=UPI0036AF1332
MKRIILLAFMLIGSRLFAQEWKVVEWEGKSQAEIRSALKVWVADYFRSAKDVLQLDEKDRIIVKGKADLNETSVSSGLSIPVNYVMDFTIDFQLKDSKYRYIIKDIFLSDRQGKYTLQSLSSENDDNRKLALQYKGNTKKGIEAGIAAIERIIDQSKYFSEKLKSDIEAIPLKTKSETENW